MNSAVNNAVNKIGAYHRYVNVFCLSLLCILAINSNANAEEKKSVCRYTKVGTIPLAVVNMRPTIAGSINGSATTMLVDTGSDSTLLTRAAVEKLGVTLSHSDVSSVGVSGESEHYDARVSEISFGPVHWGATNLGVLWSSVAELPYGAIVGTDFLFQRDIEISLSDKKLDFFDPIGCEDAFLGYWGKNVSDVALEPSSSHDRRQIIIVEVNGKKLRAMIDTGASTSVIDLAAAAKIGVTPKSAGVSEFGVGGIGTHKKTAWVASFDSFTIADETIKPVKIAIMDIWGSIQSDANYMSTSTWINEQPEMILGVDFLKAHRVLFALSQRRLYFSYVGGEVFNVNKKMVSATETQAK